MFIIVQLKVMFDGHPNFDEEEPQSLEKRLWIALAEGGLLLGPGKHETHLRYMGIRANLTQVIYSRQIQLYTPTTSAAISVSASVTPRYVCVPSRGFRLTFRSGRSHEEGSGHHG